MHYTSFHSLMIALRSVGLRITTLLLLFLLVSLTPRPIHADNHILYVNAHATGTKDGLSWANAFTSLQDAIAAANPGKEIWVAEGVYYPDEGVGQTPNSPQATFTLKNGVAIYGGFAGNEPALAQRNPTSNVTVLSGDVDHENNALVDLGKNASGVIDSTGNIRGANAFHVVTGSSTDSSARLGDD